MYPFKPTIMNSTTTSARTYFIIGLLATFLLRTAPFFFQVTEHQGCMKCLAVAPGGAPTLASGGRDNSIICWDMRVPQPAVLNVVKYSHQPMTAATSISAAAASKSKKGQQGVTKASVTALEYIDDHHLVSCSDLDGEVKVWDLRMSYDRYKGLPKCKHSIPYAGTRFGHCQVLK